MHDVAAAPIAPPGFALLHYVLYRLSLPKYSLKYRTEVNLPCLSEGPKLRDAVPSVPVMNTKSREPTSAAPKSIVWQSMQDNT